MIGRVALGQISISTGKLLGAENEFRRRRDTLPRLGMRLSFVIHAQIGGILCFQGRSCSSWAARRNTVASSPKRAANIMPSGSPAAFHASGTDIAGWPDMLNVPLQMSWQL